MRWTAPLALLPVLLLTACGDAGADAPAAAPATRSVTEAPGSVDVPVDHADTVFLHRLSGEAAARRQEVLAANPLWQRPRAVQAGRVVEVDDHWYGSGPQAAALVMDDVERALLG